MEYAIDLFTISSNNLVFSGWHLFKNIKPNTMYGSVKRCDWVSGKIHIKYHDTEWGTPLHSDRSFSSF